MFQCTKNKFWANDGTYLFLPKIVPGLRNVRLVRYVRLKHTKHTEHLIYLATKKSIY